MNPHLTEAMVQSFVDRCRERGTPATPQRIEIYRALAGSQEHPTPEMVYDRVKLSMPSVSLATIYKTLDTLVALGVASEIATVGDAKRYDANMERHHHLVCTQCHAISDFRAPAFDKLPLLAPEGFTPEYVSLRVHGLCQKCRASTSHS
jgi:Fur family peroxide stress response transcriptional regulator